MSLLISFSLLLLTLIGYSHDKRLFNPLFINPFIWGLLMLLYNLLPHNLYSLQQQILFSVVVWVLFFMLSCFIVQYSITNYHKPFDLFNTKIFSLYYYMVIIFAPLSLFTLVMEALKVGPEMFFLRLRMINTGMEADDTFSLGYLSYVFNFVTVVCLLFTYFYERMSKKRYYIVLCFAFLLGLITLARTSVLMLILGIFIILYFKSKIQKKHYIYFVFICLSFLILVTILRSQNNTGGGSLGDTLSIYLLGGLPAFDTITHNNGDEFGGYTLRFFYAVMKVIDNSTVVQQTILPYVQVPQLTNVYTVLFPFYKDFGYLGVITFAIIYGVIFGFVYKKAKNGNEFYILLLSMILPCLFLQFMSELIILNVSTYIQYIIILLIPYFFKLSR